MKIYVNGEPREVSEGCTAEQLIALLDLAGRRVAMEVNRELVPRSAFPAHRLAAEDRVEIVHAIGGGSGL